jgi:hypothetical protein
MRTFAGSAGAAVVCALGLIACQVKNGATLISDFSYAEPTKSAVFNYQDGMKELDALLDTKLDYRVSVAPLTKPDYAKLEKGWLKSYPDLAWRKGESLFVKAGGRSLEFRDKKTPKDEVDYTAFTLSFVEKEEQWLAIIKTGYEWANCVLVDAASGTTLLLAGWEILPGIKKNTIVELNLPMELGDGSFGLGVIEKDESGFSYKKMILFGGALVYDVSLAGNCLVFTEDRRE